MVYTEKKYHVYVNRHQKHLNIVVAMFLPVTVISSCRWQNCFLRRKAFRSCIHDRGENRKGTRARREEARDGDTAGGELHPPPLP